MNHGEHIKRTIKLDLKLQCYDQVYVIIVSGNKINKTQIGYAKDLDVLMPIYNLLEYIDNYSKSSGSLW